MLKSSSFLYAFCLLFVFNFSNGVSAADIQKILEEGSIEIAVYDKFSPFSYRSADGKILGIDVDIGKALASQLGVSAVFRLQPADESVEDDLRNVIWKGHYLGGGVADLMLHVPIDPAFAREVEQVRFIGPYYQEEVIVARNPARIGNAKTLVIFAQEKIGVEIDTLADSYLLGAFGGRIRDNVVHFTTVADAAKALIGDQLAGVMAPRGELEAGLGDDRKKFIISQMPMPGLAKSSWDLGIAVKAENEELAKALRKSVKVLLQNGTVKRIFDSHGITYIGPSTEHFIQTRM